MGFDPKPVWVNKRFFHWLEVWSDPSDIYVSIHRNAEQLLWNVSCPQLLSVSERVKRVQCPGDSEYLKVNKKVHRWKRNKGIETAYFTYSFWEILLKSIRSSRHNCFGELSREWRKRHREITAEAEGGKDQNELSLTGEWRMEENLEEGWD